MIRQEPTRAFRAGFLLAVGGILGLVGMLLVVGRSFFAEAVSTDATRDLARVLTWGPRALIAVGVVLAGSAAVLISAEWFQRKT